MGRRRKDDLGSTGRPFDLRALRAGRHSWLDDRLRPLPASAPPGCGGPDRGTAFGSNGVRRGRLVPSLLAIAGLGWAAIAALFFVTYTQVEALMIFGVPAGLFLAAASGWWNGRRWAPGVAVLAVIVTIALACVIIVGRFGLAGVPGAG